jgi:Protein of unknown function, DUF488
MPPRVKKVDAAIDEWIKDIVPSTALRKRFGHDPARWREFRGRYVVEVQVTALAKQGPITLVFSSYDEVRNDRRCAERLSFGTTGDTKGRDASSLKLMSLHMPGSGFRGRPSL